MFCFGSDLPGHDISSKRFRNPWLLHGHFEILKNLLAENTLQVRALHGFERRQGSARERASRVLMVVLAAAIRPAHTREARSHPQELVSAVLREHFATL